MGSYMRHVFLRATDKDLNNALTTEYLHAITLGGCVGHAMKGMPPEGATASSGLGSTEEGRTGLPVGMEGLVGAGWI